MRGTSMADLCITKKITKAKCSEPKWLCARKSKVNSTGKKQETYRVINMLKITSLTLTEERPKKLA